jgi:hypothetical protein
MGKLHRIKKLRTLSDCKESGSALRTKVQSRTLLVTMRNNAKSDSFVDAEYKLCLFQVAQELVISMMPVTTMTSLMTVISILSAILL